ncbi:inner membrane transport permease YbhR [Lentilactobacillus sunkii]|jgi:ABC-2 type transport system permease protein|uniref:Inner membrane transport permease YbhR n=1 Tax=Lentilactobacillus sunkii TaxID=481719 RepID=A0A1E7XB30_9LACO|nr:ABC transporter permease [Lentilactobacillus sunkii]OFA10228.1 inner membrane transport permease YbhR [Lentilactobacillus sunkii]
MRILTITKRIFVEMFRDKRTLALMFVAPLFILSLMYFLFQSNTNTVADIGTYNVSSSLVKTIDNKHIKIHKMSSDVSAKKTIRDKDYAGFIKKTDGKLIVTYQNADQSKTAIIKKSVQMALIKTQIKELAAATQKSKAGLMKMQAQLQQLKKQLPASISGRIPAASAPKNMQKPSSLKLTQHYLYGKSNSSFFTTMLPVFLGFMVFFFVFLISGISLLNERNSRTLDRLLATPVKRSEIIYGYLSGYGVVAIIQTAIIVLFCIYVLGIEILGSIWVVLLICFALAMVALSMGLFVSTFAASEFQMVQFIPIVVIPQIFFSGLIPVANMAGWLQAIAHIMPLYYGASALTDVIQKQANFSAVIPQFSAILVFLLVFIVLNMIGMRKYRKV